MFSQNKNKTDGLKFNYKKKKHQSKHLKCINI